MGVSIYFSTFNAITYRRHTRKGTALFGSPDAMLILINPPVAKPCEPPAGIAKLAGVLAAHRYPFTVVDGNLEGLLYLLNAPHQPQDTWSRQACNKLKDNLAALRSRLLYANLDRYKRAVADVGRALLLAGAAHGATLTLANYEEASLSPLNSADLLRAAAGPEKNPFYPWFAGRLSTLVEKKNPSLVGFSLNYLSQALTTFAMIGFLKKRFPELPLVVGGGLMTSWMRQPEWRNPFSGLVEHLVAGPGEESLCSLLGIKAQAGHSSPDYGRLAANPYLAPGFILPYAAASGCWWKRCSFCPEQAEGNPYAAISPNQVMADIDRLAAATAPCLIHFLDNAISPTLLQVLAARPLPAPWYGFARVTELIADRDFCRALRRSGCVMLKLGIESGDETVLEKMDKGIELQVASRALAALHSAGIATYVYLLFGTPAETLAAARKTLAFTRRHAAAITFLNLAVFNLPAINGPSSGLATRPFYDGDLSLYRDFEHPRGWNRKEVRLFLDREFKRDPAIRPILHRDPPLFTSNHAPFLHMGCQFPSGNTL